MENKKIKTVYLVFRVIIVIGIMTTGYMFTVNYTVSNAKQVMAQQYETRVNIVKSNNSNKIDVLKNDVLDRLKQCESGKLKLSDAPILLDTNNKISIGMFMFQRDTIIYYYTKLYHKNITKQEAVEIALSPRARTLASDIIFKEKGGIFNWRNCARQKGLTTEVTIIKRIQ